MNEFYDRISDPTASTQNDMHTTNMITAETVFPMYDIYRTQAFNLILFGNTCAGLRL